ncbi:hypothetical protein V1517DRAFT_79537 [Lipomyces orientalis]|uniref:Uncharacterized protein n=1 Tax=Lipomyces orientalis TaxID=1233043 RepID=A0ACC3TCW3_9ASCO
MSGSESCSSCGNNEISVDGGSSSAFATLSTYLQEALHTKSVFVGASTSQLAAVPRLLQMEHAALVRHPVPGVAKDGHAVFRRLVKENWSALTVSAKLVHGGASAGCALHLVHARMSTSVLRVSASLVRGVVKDGHAARHLHARERTNATMVSAKLVHGVASAGRALHLVRARMLTSVLMVSVSLVRGVAQDGLALLRRLARVDISVKRGLCLTNMRIEYDILVGCSFVTCMITCSY